VGIRQPGVEREDRNLDSKRKPKRAEQPELSGAGQVGTHQLDEVERGTTKLI